MELIVIKAETFLKAHHLEGMARYRTWTKLRKLANTEATLLEWDQTINEKQLLDWSRGSDEIIEDARELLQNGYVNYSKKEEQQ